ncbi:MAG TPA: hypothetical protein VLF89_10335 [Candidatus Saccharimonadales bacterium]|nr:hypothetical protein [Candidatus Saccharimonadales bacterium]
MNPPVPNQPHDKSGTLGSSTLTTFGSSQKSSFQTAPDRLAIMSV